MGIWRLIQKWWFYVDQTHVRKGSVRFVCTGAHFWGQENMSNSRRIQINLRSKKTTLLPARDASSFWLEKSGGPMLWACLAPQDPSLAGRSRSPFFDRPGRFIFVSQIEANFEIHEFINSGWPKWCPRGSPQKKPSLKKNVILPARDAC